MSSYDVDMTGVDLVGTSFMAKIRERAVAKAKAAVDPNRVNLNLRTDAPVMTQVDPNALKKAGGGHGLLYGALALGGVFIAFKVFKKKK